MAVLKSFELNGNKQSFANWISNLSPCDTPFTSMIGKEGIDQVQYSWQTDKLAPADNTSYEEGSQVASQTRASTSVITNFTSTLRKVVQVTETAEAVAKHGRGSELGYQMGKSGKEILRDLEWMNLSNVNGNPGTKALASKFAGFEGLVGGMNIPDPDTGAVIHKTVMVSGTTQTRMEKNDIFDMTYNLYLAGSKADKIMFHPKHASVFTAFINDNADEPMTYRMFDNLDSVYNAFVKTVRDPLGRVYTLIPNRNMPEDKMYFFTESDWTQMILRQPTTTRLMKDSSSERFLLEMEVGLRHRHPYASGVLTLSTVLVQNNFNPTRKVFTAAIGDSLLTRSEVTIDGVAEKDLEVHWFSNNESILSFDNAMTLTNTQGRAANTMRAGKKEGVVNVWSVCRGVKSQVTQITVLAPTLNLAVDVQDPDKGAFVNLSVGVSKAGGASAGSDLKIKWYVNPSNHLELDSVESTTVDGIATVRAKVLKKDTTVIQASLLEFDSNIDILNYTPLPHSIVDFKVTPNTIDVGGFSGLSAKVLDERGMPMQGVTVNWVSSNNPIGSPAAATSVTDDKGVALQAMEGISRGTAKASAVVGTISSEETTFYVGFNATLDLEINPDPAKMGEPVRFHGSIKAQDGQGIPDVQFVIASDMGTPPMRLNVTTDDDGEFDETYTFTTNSDQVISVQIPSLNIHKDEKLIVHDALGVGPVRPAEVTPQPIPVGGKSTAKVVLTDGSGFPLKNAEIKWDVTPAHVVVANNYITRTDDNGMSAIELTGVSKGMGEIIYHANRKTSEKATFLIGQGTELVLTHSPEKPLSNQEVTITGVLKRSDNSAPIVGAEVILTCSPDASYFPVAKLTTNAQGVVEYKTIFITEENFVINANAPAFDVDTNSIVEVQPIDGAGDIKYVHSVSGHTVRHTHSIPTDLPVTLYTTQHGGLPALNMKMECLDLDPSVAYSIVPNVTTNTEGKILFHIRGLKAGVARFRVRAIGAIANFLDFEVTVADPQLNITISPTTVGGGKRVEFSADLKDTHNNWVPGVNIRWEYPHNMLANGGQLGVQETDQFGRVYYDRVAALWGSHKIRAILENNTLVRSRDHTLTIHM